MNKLELFLLFLQLKKKITGSILQNNWSRNDGAIAFAEYLKYSYFSALATLDTNFLPC